MKLPSTLGQRLRWARETAGVSARWLDKRAGLGIGHTSMIESEMRADPKASTVALLAQALGVSLDWLVSGIGDPPSERRLRRTGTSG